MTAPVRHLDLEDLAAHVDGTADPALRAAVEEHLVACSACYDLFVDVTALVSDEPGVAAAAAVSPRRHFALRPVLAGLAAASLLIFAWTQWRGGADREIDRHIATIVNAAAAERLTAGRLSGEERWAAAPSPTRGAAAGALPLEAQESALALQRVAASRRDVKALRGAGVALLAVGRVDDAIEALEDGAALSSGDAPLHNDLAAALLERASRNDEPSDAARALDHAERAVRLGGDGETYAFNQALAHEMVGNWPRAVELWRAYLAAHGTGAWAEEARSRLARLQAGTAGRLPFQPAAGLLGSDLAAAAREHPAWLDEALAMDVLPRWAARRDDADAAAAYRLGAALVAAGWRSPATAIASALPTARGSGRGECLAGSAAAIARWQRAADSGDTDVALEAASEAARMVACAGLEPLYSALPQAWAEMTRRNARDAARIAAAAAARAAAAGAFVIEAQLFELLGALAIEETRMSDATEARARGRAAAVRARHVELAGRFDELMGEAADEHGDRGAAWAHFHRALTSITDASAPIHRYAVLSTVTIAAANGGLHAAAAAFADDLIAAAAGTGRPTHRVMALMQRGRARAALGDVAGGAGDLAQAEAVLEAMPEGRAQRAWRAEMGWVTGVVNASSNPDAALRGLTESIEYFEAFGRRFRLAELLLHRGRVHRTLGNPSAALADWTRGAEILEDQRPSIREEQLRISRTDEVWELFSSLIDLLEPDPSAALSAFERAKARELLDALAPEREQPSLEVGALQACFPSGARALVYAVLPSKLLIWQVTRDAVTVRSEPIARRRVERLVDDAVESVRETGSGAGAAELGRLLLPAALTGSLTADDVLILVPDGALARLPFAALPAGGRPLVEQVTPLLAPSLSTFCLSSGRSVADPSGAALLVGLGEAIPAAGLPALPEVGAEIESLERVYHDRTVLVGPAASAEAVSRSLNGHAVVHFAGHAVVDERHPSRSALYVAPVSGAAPAMLRARDIAAARIDPGASVVLAACQTATGRAFLGEGTMSLARPFLAAGAGAVLGTLWNIRDADARQVVERVHVRLAAGQRLEMALAGAQREMIRAGLAPRVWSGYVVTGGVTAGGQNRSVR